MSKLKEKARLVKCKFWSDEFVQDLPPLEKLLFLYLITNELTNVAGCYEITMRRIVFDTGLTETIIRQSIDHLTQSGKILFREGWLSLRNSKKHQNYQSEDVKKGIQNIIDSVPIVHRQYIDSVRTITRPPEQEKEKGEVDFEGKEREKEKLKRKGKGSEEGKTQVISEPGNFKCGSCLTRFKTDPGEVCPICHDNTKGVYTPHKESTSPGEGSPSTPSSDISDINNTIEPLSEPPIVDDLSNAL